MPWDERFFMFFKAYTAHFTSTRARHRQYVNFQKEDFIMYSMEQVVNLAKHRGFVFPGSEIYGGLANTWDYGPLGIELKNNVKKAWWKKFIQESPHNVGLDAAILMNPKTWIASGHVGNFNDPTIDCKNVKRVTVLTN